MPQGEQRPSYESLAAHPISNRTSWDVRGSMDQRPSVESLAAHPVSGRPSTLSQVAEERGPSLDAGAPAPSSTRMQILILLDFGGLDCDRMASYLRLWSHAEEQAPPCLEARMPCLLCLLPSLPHIP